MFLERGQHRLGGEAEHAGVPGIAARAYELLGGREVRLLHEALHLAGHLTELVARLDIAEAGLRPRRLDAEGDQPSLLGKLSRFADRSDERLLILDQMI